MKSRSLATDLLCLIRIGYPLSYSFMHFLLKVFFFTKVQSSCYCYPSPVPLDLHLLLEVLASLFHPAKKEKIEDTEAFMSDKYL